MSSNREALNKIAVGRVARAVQAATGGTAESDELDAVATEELKDFCAEVKGVRWMQKVLPAGAAGAAASCSAPPAEAAKPPKAFCTDYVSVLGCQLGAACPYPHLEKKDTGCPHIRKASHTEKGAKCEWRH